MDYRFNPNRRRTLQNLGAGTIALALAPFARAANPVIKIGYVSPQTGPLAAFGETDNFTLQVVRERLKNGILIAGKTYNVEIVVKDSQSSSNRAAQVASDLINRDKVHLMLCAATPDTTNPVSDQCELAEIPCVSTAAPWEAWYFGRGATPTQGFDWTYHFFFGLGNGIACYTDIWAQLPTNKTVGFLFANDSDGEAWSDKVRGLPPALEKAGYKLVNPGRFQTGTDNFTAHIAAFKKANVDIITGVMNPPDFTTFWRQAQQQGFKPKIATIAKALVFPAAVENLGASADGLTSEVVWSRHFPFKSTLTGQGCSQYADFWETQTKKQAPPALGWIHALFEVGIDVLKRSSNPMDHAAVRDAIRKTQLQTLLGPVNFSTGPNPNVSIVSLVGGQWRPGKTHKLEQQIIANGAAPAIKLTAKLRPLA